MKHGILTKKIEFQTDGERREFRKVFERCNSECPKKISHDFLVQEIAITLYKLGITTRIEVAELLCRESNTRGIRDLFHSSHIKLPISSRAVPGDGTWNCEQLELRAVAANDRSDSTVVRVPLHVNGQRIDEGKRSGTTLCQDAQDVEIRAVLANPLTTIVRYQSSLKRDLYRAFRERERLLSEE